ncbi:unnamed protein product, partial [Staurois parvus]
MTRDCRLLRSGYRNLTGTHSHFRCDRLGERNLLGHVTGPRRL